MTESRTEVTRFDVERLWSAAITATETWDVLAESASELVQQANAENPVVNRGLLDFYYLSRPGADRDAELLIKTHDRWRAELAAFDTDPAAWMRSYFRKLLAEFVGKHGVDKARTFGRKLLAQGHLAESDIADVLGS